MKYNQILIDGNGVNDYDAYYKCNKTLTTLLMGSRVHVFIFPIFDTQAKSFVWWSDSKYLSDLNTRFMVYKKQKLDLILSPHREDLSKLFSSLFVLQLSPYNFWSLARKQTFKIFVKSITTFRKRETARVELKLNVFCLIW